MSGIDRIRRNALRALAPPLRLPLGDWIKKDMRLPPTVSAVPGRVTLYPYQRGVCDALSDPTIERITWVKPVRIGATTLLTAALANYVANEPSLIMLLLPNEQMCRDYVTSDLEPIFDATPILRGLITDGAEDRSVMLSKRFAGGSLKIIPARSPARLRAHNVRILFIDEPDGMEITKEGDPVTLAERRTLSFPNRKIFMASTPTIEETSPILRAYARSDQRIYEIRCVECGEYAEPLWNQIQWDPPPAYWVCPNHGCIVPESRKAEMVANGRWRITKPEVKGHAGFRCNALISTLANASWEKLRLEWVSSQGSPDQLQTFVNTILAQGWRESADQIDESELATRAEDFSLAAIHPDVLILCAGVDVQHDRLEVSFVGFGRTDIFVLSHVVIYGNPLEDAVWAELDGLLKPHHAHPKGGLITVSAAIVDSSDGHATGMIYSYCHARLGKRIFAGKGVPGFSRPAAIASQTKGAKLMLIGVDGLKNQILNRLTSGRTLRFSKSLPEHYWDQVTSERRVVRYQKGVPVRRFERIPGRVAEALDCLVYSMAARSLVNVNLDARESELASATLPKPAPQVIKSKWMERAY